MKKHSLILLTFLLLLPILIFPIKQASANSTLIKIAAGEAGARLMYGIAERAGTHFGTQSAYSRSLQRWNLDVDHYYKVEDAQIRAKMAQWEQETLRNSKVTPLEGRPGYSKYILTGAAFLTGVDLIYEAYHKFNNAYQTSSYAEVMAANMQEGNYYTKAYGLYLNDWSSGTNNGQQFKQYGWFSETDPSFQLLFDGAYVGTPDSYFKILSDYGTDKVIEAYALGLDVYNQMKKSANSDNLSVGGWNPDGAIYEAFKPEVSDIPEITVPSIIPPNIFDEGISNLPIPSDFPEEIAIIVPDTLPDLNADPVPINEPLTESNPMTDPVPVEEPAPDTDTGDPTEPPTGTTPPTSDPSPVNPFKTLFPGTWLLAILDLLRAIIEYLIRMFKFVLTIPNVTPIPIDNEAFVWFRQAEIVGIKIFNVVSSLATIGLSFAVYKSVRRVLP